MNEYEVKTTNGIYWVYADRYIQNGEIFDFIKDDEVVMTLTNVISINY